MRFRKAKMGLIGKWNLGAVIGRAFTYRIATDYLD